MRWVALLCIGVILLAVLVPIISPAWVRHAVLYAVLEIGALSGVPMTPEKIEEVMNATKRVKIERVITRSDDPPIS